MLPAHKILLSRNLFYTAITCAKLRVILVGYKKALSIAMRLIQAVELYAPDNNAGKTLKGYIFMSLGYALRTCNNSQAQGGVREAPPFLPNAVISMEVLEVADPYWEMRIAA